METTIPSAYVSTRPDPTSVHRRELTRAWWTDQAPRYDVSISEAVMLEPAQGDWPGKAIAIGLVEPLQRAAVTEEAADVARRYVRELPAQEKVEDIVVDRAEPGAPLSKPLVIRHWYGIRRSPIGVAKPDRDEVGKTTLGDSDPRRSSCGRAWGRGG